MSRRAKLPSETYIDELRVLADPIIPIQELATAWDKMADIQFTKPQLLDVLKCVSYAICSHREHDRGGAYHRATARHISERASLWVDKILPHIPNFNQRELADSFIAFGMMGVHPGKEFFKAWKERATASEFYWRKRDRQALMKTTNRLQLPAIKDITDKKPKPPRQKRGWRSGYGPRPR